MYFTGRLKFSKGRVNQNLENFVAKRSYFVENCLLCSRQFREKTHTHFLKVCITITDLINNMYYYLNNHICVNV